MGGPYSWIAIMVIWTIPAILNIKASRITKVEYYLMWLCLMVSYLQLFIVDLR